MRAELLSGLLDELEKIAFDNDAYIRSSIADAARRGKPVPHSVQQAARLAGIQLPEGMAQAPIPLQRVVRPRTEVEAPPPAAKKTPAERRRPVTPAGAAPATAAPPAKNQVPATFSRTTPATPVPAAPAPRTPTPVPAQVSSAAVSHPSAARPMSAGVLQRARSFVTSRPMAAAVGGAALGAAGLGLAAHARKKRLAQQAEAR